LAGGHVAITVQYDNVIENFSRELERQYMPALRFAKQIAARELKLLMVEAVYVMGERAGEGFPESYTNHLASEVAKLPITVSEGIGLVSLNMNFDRLGDYEDLMLGAHMNALLKDGMDYDDFKSFRITTKPAPKNTLPNSADEGDLFNTKEERTEWWNRAIVRGDTYAWVGKDWSWTKAINQTAENAWVVPDVPTFEQVASARINQAWKPNGVAPEWLILENGSPPGTEPTVYPQAFLAKMALLFRTASQEIFSHVVREMEERILSGAIRIQKAGRYGTAPVDAASRRYIPYLETSVPDLQQFLALI